MYVEYLEEHELSHDLESDPYQLDNFYSTADPDLIAQLGSQLDPLRDCAAASCRTAEDRADDHDSASRYDGNSRAEGHISRDGDGHKAVALSVDEERREHCWSD